MMDPLLTLQEAIQAEQFRAAADAYATAYATAYAAAYASFTTAYVTGAIVQSIQNDPAIRRQLEELRRQYEQAAAKD